MSVGWVAQDRNYTEGTASGADANLRLPVGGVETWHLSDLSSSLVGLVDGTTLVTTVNHSIVLSSEFGGTPGLHCNATSILETSAPNANLQLTGDMTAEMILHIHAPAGQLGGGISTFFAYGSSLETEVTNTVYQLQTASATGVGFVWSSESGAGVDSTVSTADCIPFGRIIHLAATRESDEVKIYVDGVLASTLGTATTPTGGGDSKLYLASNASGLTLNCTIWSARFKNTADSAAAVRATYDATLGQKWPLANA